MQASRCAYYRTHIDERARLLQLTMIVVRQRSTEGATFSRVARGNTISEVYLIEKRWRSAGSVMCSARSWRRCLRLEARFAVR